ncbi:MAG: hypothetical protein FWE59_02080 [Oscillospiraceae bacterium]|nr:hypothetical protein [Oscillospiraceae bacterium]
MTGYRDGLLPGYAVGRGDVVTRRRTGVRGGGVTGYAVGRGYAPRGLPGYGGTRRGASPTTCRMMGLIAVSDGWYSAACGPYDAQGRVPNLTRPQ